MKGTNAKGIFRTALSLLFAVLVGACGTSPTTVAKKGLEYDQYAGQWVLGGSVLNGGEFWKSVMTDIQTYAWLRGTFDRSGQNQAIQLYAICMGGGAGQLVAMSASDSTGAALTTHRVENTSVQRIAGQPFYAPKEVVAIDLPRRFLDERRANGLDIRLQGFNNAKPIVKVPAEYLSNYLDEFDTAVKQNKGKK
jgi:hypothetical protein